MTIAQIRVPRGERFYVRPGTCDEVVLRDDYQGARFFPPGLELAPDAIVVDAGAHIGAFAVTAAARVPAGRVHAVEPAAANAALLAVNIALNQRRNVSVHRLALSAAAGPAVLHHGGESWADTLDPGAAGGSSEPVEALTLEGFLATQAIRRVAYLKMNIEGAEYGVLATAPVAVLRTVDRMLVEVHPAPAGQRRKLVQHLESCGFEARFVADREPGKGWLDAERRSP